MGISTDQLAHITAEEAVPNFPAIAALAEESGCSLYWIAFAREPQMVSNALSTEKRFIENAGDAVQIPSLVEGTSYAIPRIIVDLHHLMNVVTLAGMHAPGDAMEPTIKADGFLLVDVSVQHAIDGAIFVFDFDGERVVRRTQRQPGGALLLSADNPNYRPITVAAEAATAAKVLGRVVWAAGSL